MTAGWRRILEHAKLPGFRLYDLRRIFATELLVQGAPITYVAAQLRHTKPTTTLQWYAHWLPRGVAALDSAGAKDQGDPSSRSSGRRRRSDREDGADDRP